jgi:hypothetical protein
LLVFGVTRTGPTFFFVRSIIQSSSIRNTDYFAPIFHCKTDFLNGTIFYILHPLSQNLIS